MAAAVIGLLVFLLGLCIGSFLNVVVYRLPRGLKISQPVWSFCPDCQTTLRWYDNIPIVSWLLLRARCRYCGKPISSQYPLVEAITGLAFVLTYFLLFVVHARFVSVSEYGTIGVQPIWPRDAALLLAWLVLITVLIACSSMDLILYIIDTRATDVALFAGIVGYALWPAPAAFDERAASPGAAGAVAAAVISVIMIWLSNRAHPGQDPKESSPEENLVAPQPLTPTAADRAATVLAILLFIALAVWILFSMSGSSIGGMPSLQRYLVPAALIAFFVAMVLTGGQSRPIDDELHATLEAEAPEARRTALRECAWLMPATIGGVIAYLLVQLVPAVGDLWAATISWQPFGDFAPLGGIAFSLHGAVVAAAAGWFIRIFFTFAFGREAFGTGDIYILAAAGAVGGWDIALLGFLLSVPIALAGWILSLILKRTGMIPFGPPLAIGFLAALWLNRPAAVIAENYRRVLEEAWTDRRGVVLMGIGLLLVVLPVSIIIARLIRRLIEPQTDQNQSQE